MSGATAMSVAPFVLALAALALVVAGSPWTTAGVAILVAYVALLVFSAALAAVRFRSPAVGLLMPFVLVATQAAYVGGFLAGLVGGPDGRRVGTSGSIAADDLDP